MCCGPAVRTPAGPREQVHDKWLKLQQRARQGPMATSVPKLGEFLAYWLEEVVKPNLAPATYVNVVAGVSVCVVR